VEIRFRCKSCNRSFTMKLNEIPAGGIRGKCGACGAPIRLFADGRPEDAAPEPKVAPAKGARAGEREAAASPGRGLSFECPACGHPHVVDPSKIPSKGAKGPCKKCGAPIVLHQDGRISMAGKESPAKTVGQSEGAWFLRHDGGETGPFTLDELGELADSGGLTPDKEVHQGDGRWMPAGAVAALAALFNAQGTKAPAEDLATGDEDHCFAHADVAPVRQCAQCGRFLCEACLKRFEKGTVGVKPILLCSACGGTTIVLKRREKWPSFYADMPYVLSSPFKGHALFYFCFLSFLEMVKIPCRFAGLYGLAAIFIVTCFQFAFYIHLVREVANGSYEFPEWPDTTNFGDMAVTFLKVLVVAFVSLVPLILIFCLGSAGFSALLHFTGGGSPGEALGAAALPLTLLLVMMFVFYLIYLPICVAIVALFETVLPGLNPVLIFRIISRIGPPYFMAVALWGSLIVILAFAETVLNRSMGLLGVLVAAPINVYVMLVSAYILGRVCYENEEKIGWY